MAWEVEYTDEFERWWSDLTDDEQGKVAASIRLLENYGPTLDHPHTSSIKESRHSKMRELRIQIGGRPIRILYVFDPRRIAILLLGGDKTGDPRWYEKNVLLADDLYDRHLREIEKEGEKDG